MVPNLALFYQQFNVCFIVVSQQRCRLTWPVKTEKREILSTSFFSFVVCKCFTSLILQQFAMPALLPTCSKYSRLYQSCASRVVHSEYLLALKPSSLFESNPFNRALLLVSIPSSCIKSCDKLKKSRKLLLHHYGIFAIPPADPKIFWIITNHYSALKR